MLRASYTPIMVGFMSDIDEDAHADIRRDRNRRRAVRSRSRDRAGRDPRKRIKKPSKAYRAHYGHTPLSADEAIPWHGKSLFVGTGMYGKLPVTPELYAAAEEKGIKVVARPSPGLFGILQKLKPKDVNAVLHSPVESRASPRSASAGLAPDAAQKKTTRDYPTRSSGDGSR